MSYDEARKIIEAQGKILVAPCICRKEHEMVGKGCGKPKEACLIFAGGAYFYEKNGIGRVISKEEALDLLKMAEENALVLQPSNAQKVMNICLCCGCCCQVLKNLKRYPQPAKIIHANYYAKIRPEECIGCEICLERCQMDAISMEEGVANIDLDRCIGCGLCVPTCSGPAIDLVQKEECYVPPANIVETYMRIAQERGLL